MDQFPRHIHGELCGAGNPEGLGRSYSCDFNAGHNPITVNGAEWAHGNLEHGAWWGPIPAVPLEDFLLNPELRQFRKERREAGIEHIPEVPGSGQIDVDYLLKGIRRFIHETPQESIKALETLSVKLVDLGLMANAKKTQNCTEWSAGWCALHGDCTCGNDREFGGWHIDCPLHGNDTDHAFEYEEKN